jgi:hypothetical protein
MAFPMCNLAEQAPSSVIVPDAREVMVAESGVRGYKPRPGCPRTLVLAYGSCPEPASTAQFKEQ